MWKKIKKDILIILFVQIEVILIGLLMLIVASLIGINQENIKYVILVITIDNILVSIFGCCLNHSGYLDNL